MRCLIFRIAGLLAPVLLLAAGCSKVNDERTVEIEPGVEKTLTVDSALTEQKITVQFSSPDEPINVYLYLEKDQKEVEKFLSHDTMANKILAKGENSKGETLECTVPAKNKLSILITSRNKATVKVKISNQQK